MAKEIPVTCRIVPKTEVTRLTVGKISRTVTDTVMPNGAAGHTFFCEVFAAHPTDPDSVYHFSWSEAAVGIIPRGGLDD